MNRFCFLWLLLPFTAWAQKNNLYQINSPDGRLQAIINANKQFTWQVAHNGVVVVKPSAITLVVNQNDSLGVQPKVVKATTQLVNENFTTPFYKKASVSNHYQQLTLQCKGNFALVVRAYNDGVAYRFETTKKDSMTVVNEVANFNFESNCKAYIPYIRDWREQDKFCVPFESHYDEITLGQFQKDSLAILPLLVAIDAHKKVAVLEADVESYPGMFTTTNAGKNGLTGVFAPCPLAERIGGFAKLNLMPVQRAPYIARTVGTRTFPWRAIVVSETDKELANNDMVQKLAAPCRIAETSWIKPGKVAWDWWNNWNITKVDFKAGVNTETYLYYIDFAAANGIEYIVMDEGWSQTNELLKIKPSINLQKIVAHAKEKKVGVFLWATLQGMLKQTNQILATYAQMGIKGFKIDFVDRDDQKMVDYVYQIAQKAADYQLMIDYHGMYKPTGIQRTYPNIVNFEGVKGMENNKWTANDDVPKYDVTAPFIRMLAGPMDYTPGAMRNATKASFRPDNNMPMSQGTRCHQLAMYTLFEAPLQMLADNPTAYMKEQECTQFIAQIPTVFDETVALDGAVAKYIALARRKGTTWYVGAMTNWDARTLQIDGSFLGEGTYEAEIFEDGINADRDATDYKRSIIAFDSHQKLTIKLQNGGGWAAIIKKK
jgi:alpha-glucosidase